MAQVGTLTVDLIAQTASFNANIEKAARNLNSQTARMNRSLASISKGVDSITAAGRGAALALAGVGFVQLARQGLDYAASLGETSQQLGVTTRDLQVYRYIGTQVGITQEEMEKGLGKLTISLGQAALGAQGQGKAFAALGINVRDASGHVKTAGQVIPEIADKLKGIADPAQRAAIEVALFGRAGQKLDTILTEGRQGITDYGKAAEEAGMIIGDDVAKNADIAADKIAALTTQLKVNFSREVAENANAILGLATALEKATFAGIHFVSNYPRLSGALAGAAVGARVGGGYGAAVGAAAGYIAGDSLAQSAANENPDLNFRRDRLAEARRKLDAERAAGMNRVDPVTGKRSVDVALAAYNEQANFWNQAVRAAKAQRAAATAPGGADLPDFLASGGGGRKPKSSGASAADKARDKAIRDQRDFDDMLARVNGDLLDARRDNVISADALAQIARDQVQADAEKLKTDIEAKVSLGTYSREKADQLEAVIRQTTAEQLMTITVREAQRKAEEALMIQQAANDNQRDILQAAESLATTAADRRALQLRLLDLDKREEQARLEAVVAAAALGKATAAEAQAAQARLGKLGQIYGGRAAAVRKQTMGPLESYADGLRLSPEQINERVQQFTVDELNAVHDGITSAITGAIGTNDPFISNMISLLVDQLLIRPITEALMKAQGAGGGGGFGGLLGSIGGLLGGGGGLVPGVSASFAPSASMVSSASSLASLPFFADGTGFAPGGLAMVGERGPELVNLPRGSGVTPAPQSAALLRQMAYARNDNGFSGTAHFHFPNVTSAREARESGDQAARAFRRRMNGPVRSAS